MITSVRFAGSGGQGAVLSGILLAQAAVLYEDKYVTQKDRKFAIQLQTYGPETRGTVSKSDVKISDRKITYPYVEIPDIFVVMSEMAYKKYEGQIGKETIVILEKTLVNSRPAVRYYEIPARRTAAQDIGSEIVTNTVMLGALCSITNIVSKEALKNAIRKIIPEDKVTINLNALEKGYQLGQDKKEKEKKKGE